MSNKYSSELNISRGPQEENFYLKFYLLFMIFFNSLYIFYLKNSGENNFRLLFKKQSFILLYIAKQIFTI